ncbi:unnamed protein product [Pylaiella littoralis]
MCMVRRDVGHRRLFFSVFGGTRLCNLVVIVVLLLCDTLSPALPLAPRCVARCVYAEQQQQQQLLKYSMCCWFCPTVRADQFPFHLPARGGTIPEHGTFHEDPPPTPPFPASIRPLAPNTARTG